MDKPLSPAFVEATRLLKGMRLANNRAAYREGKHAAILANSFFDPESKKIRVLVSCQALHGKADWNDLLVWLRSEAPRRPIHICRVDARGTAVFDDLDPDTYTLSTHRLHHVSARNLTLPQVVPETAKMTATLSPDKVVMLAPFQSRPYESEDHTVRARVQMAAGGGVELVFESQPAMVGRLVFFSLVDRDGLGTSVGTAELTPGDANNSVAHARIDSVPTQWGLVFWVDEGSTPSVE